MALETKYLTSLVELAHRRHAPQSADLQRSLHLARLFEADPSIPIAYRSLAWHVITDSHESAGWPMPDGERFPACCGAAASTKHGCALLTQEIADQVAMIEGPAMLFGALAASRSVFGTWSIFPTSGAYLVPLGATGENRSPANVYRDSVGVRWGSPGDLRSMFEEHSKTAELAGLEVLIPAPELITARTAGCAENAAELECLIFCAAARATTAAGKWNQTVGIAPKLGSKYTPLEAAYRMRIDHWLGVGISPPKRAVYALRRLFGVGRAA